MEPTPRISSPKLLGACTPKSRSTVTSCIPEKPSSASVIHAPAYPDFIGTKVRDVDQKPSPAFAGAVPHSGARRTARRHPSTLGPRIRRGRAGVRLAPEREQHPGSPTFPDWPTVNRRVLPAVSRRVVSRRSRNLSVARAPGSRAFRRTSSGHVEVGCARPGRRLAAGLRIRLRHSRERPGTLPPLRGDCPAVRLFSSTWLAGRSSCNLPADLPLRAKPVSQSLEFTSHHHRKSQGAFRDPYLVLAHFAAGCSAFVRASRGFRKHGFRRGDSNRGDLRLAGDWPTGLASGVGPRPPVAREHDILRDSGDSGGQLHLGSGLQGLDEADGMKKVRRAAAIVLGAVFLVALSAGFLAPARYDRQFREAPNAPPSWQHPLGTDELGRDAFSRLLYGSCVSLLLAPAAALLATLIAALIGGVAGYALGCDGPVAVTSMALLAADRARPAAAQRFCNDLSGHHLCLARPIGLVGVGARDLCRGAVAAGFRFCPASPRLRVLRTKSE